MAIAAQVKSVTLKSTKRGDRVYVILQTADGQDLGIWAPADHPQLCALQAGDTVQLRRDRRGSHHLVPGFRPQVRL